MADLGLERALDPQVRARAAESGAVIVTKDEDFAVHQLLQGGPSIVWVRIGNARRGVVAPLLELPKIMAALERGETLFGLA